MMHSRFPERVALLSDRRVPSTCNACSELLQVYSAGLEVPHTSGKSPTKQYTPQKHSPTKQARPRTSGTSPTKQARPRTSGTSPRKQAVSQEEYDPEDKAIYSTYNPTTRCYEFDVSTEKGHARVPLYKYILPNHQQLEYHDRITLVDNLDAMLKKHEDSRLRDARIDIQFFDPETNYMKKDVYHNISDKIDRSTFDEKKQMFVYNHVTPEKTLETVGLHHAIRDVLAGNMPREKKMRLCDLIKHRIFTEPRRYDSDKKLLDLLNTRKQAM